MCRQLTILAQNDHQQVVLICEHDTIHLVNRHITVMMSRHAFYQLNGMLRSRHFTNGGNNLRFRHVGDGDVELWIGSGAFSLRSAALFALSQLVQAAADRLRTTSLSALLAPTTATERGSPPNPLLN